MTKSAHLAKIIEPDEGDSAQSSGIRQSLEKGLLNIFRHVKADHSKRNDTVSKFEIDRHEF